MLICDRCGTKITYDSRVGLLDNDLCLPCCRYIEELINKALTDLSKPPTHNPPSPSEDTGDLP